MRDDDLEEDQENIDAELEAAVTRVTQTAAENKSLLDIIVEITVEEEPAAAKFVPTANQQTPKKYLAKTPKVSNKRKREQTS